jgi:hypothetical protein
LFGSALVALSPMEGIAKEEMHMKESGK